jgi:hypothetical protein
MNLINLLTQHDKARAIAPALESAGFAVLTINGFDTDTLGTFTGETVRLGSQLDAAMDKARKACELSGQRFGLGSEGSFGPDPFAGMSPWASELIVWWDAQDQRAVTAWVQGGATNYAQTSVSNWQQALAFAAQVQFPSHGVIVGKPGEAHFAKDLTTMQQFRASVQAGLDAGPVWLQSDMRAHRNPTRMAMIALCAQKLSSLLQRHCPSCNSVGFGLESPIVGARCSQCGLPTLAMRAKRIQCAVCKFEIEEAIRDTVLPSRCEHCNP